MTAQQERPRITVPSSLESTGKVQFGRSLHRDVPFKRVDLPSSLQHLLGAADPLGEQAGRHLWQRRFRAAPTYLVQARK
jgi:hypothetical protein